MTDYFKCWQMKVVWVVTKDIDQKEGLLDGEELQMRGEYYLQHVKEHL